MGCCSFQLRAEFLGENTHHTCSHTLTSHFKMPRNELLPKDSCNIKCKQLEIVFGTYQSMRGSVPTEECEGQFAEFQLRAACCCTELSCHKCSAYSIPAWPLDTTVGCSSSNSHHPDRVFRGALFGVLLVTSAVSPFLMVQELLSRAPQPWPTHDTTSLSLQVSSWGKPAAATCSGGPALGLGGQKLPATNKSCDLR